MSGENARRACLFFLERLRLEISRLSEVPFRAITTVPEGGSNLFAGSPIQQRGYLQSAAKSGASPVDAKQLVEDAETLAGQAYAWLRHVAGADATAISHQVVAPFQRWVKALGISDTIFFRGEHLSNYELGTFDLERFAKTLQNPSKSLLKATKDISWPLRRVTVPSQALGMFPHFAVVAHELGHAIQDTIKPNICRRHSADETAFFNRLKTSHAVEQRDLRNHSINPVSDDRQQLDKRTQGGRRCPRDCGTSIFLCAVRLPGTRGGRVWHRLDPPAF